jgi:hypothetical protein
VAVVPFPAAVAGHLAGAAGVDVADAVDRYLDSVKAPATRASYAETLAHFTALVGQRDAGTLQPGDYAAVMERWDGTAPATWNRHLSALTSFTTWAQRNEILATSPARRLERRKPARRGDRSIPRTRLEKLFADDKQRIPTGAWAEELLRMPDDDVRKITAAAVAAARDQQLAVPSAARRARQALLDLPGAKTGDPFASAVIVAAAPDRMAIYDSRAHLGLWRAGLRLADGSRLYERYMELIEQCRAELRDHSHGDWTGVCQSRCDSE